MRWDIFCKVIDNHGDLGVCWRLSGELAARGDTVRLWVDDPAALAWMAPGGCPGVEVLAWHADSPGLPAGDAVVEAFGCDPHHAFLESLAAATRQGAHPPAWFNLEYLSAEDYVERCHGLPSPVLAGPARGLAKRFFYPGFTDKTGGLLRERDLAQRRARFDRQHWLAQHGVPDTGEQMVSLFCYEPAQLPQLLAHLAAAPRPTRLLVTAGRARAAVEATRAQAGPAGLPPITWLPYLTQSDYDHLLWSCDLNFVRGEDSLVRALWAGRPFVWQIYRQDDGAHAAKLEAFLERMQGPASWREFHRAWNGLGGPLPPPQAAAWAPAIESAAASLAGGIELVTRLREAAGAPQGGACP